MGQSQSDSMDTDDPPLSSLPQSQVNSGRIAGSSNGTQSRINSQSSNTINSCSSSDAQSRINSQSSNTRNSCSNDNVPQNENTDEYYNMIFELADRCRELQKEKEQGRIISCYIVGFCF